MFNGLFEVPDGFRNPSKVCQKCKKEKPIGAFGKESGNKVRSQCKECTAVVTKVRTGLKKVILKPSADYVCPICNDNEERILSRVKYVGKTYTAWSLDHDHDTGEFRAWLCNKCNLGLGNFNDDPARLQKCIDYLNRFIR
jgi:ribosomal protein L37AE/L43A